MSVSSPAHPNDLSTDTDGFSEPHRNTRTTPSSHPVDYSSPTDLGSSPEGVYAIPSLPASRQTDSSTSSSASSSPAQPYNLNLYPRSTESERDLELGQSLSQLFLGSDEFSTPWALSESQQTLYPRTSTESLSTQRQPPSTENDDLHTQVKRKSRGRKKIRHFQSNYGSERQLLIEKTADEEVATMNSACAGICGPRVETAEWTENGDIPLSASGRKSYIPSGNFALCYDGDRRCFITTTKSPVPNTDEDVVNLSNRKKIFYKGVDLMVWWLVAVAFLANVANVIALMVHIFIAGLEESDISLAHTHLYFFLASSGLVSVVCLVQKAMYAWPMIRCLRSLQNRQEVLCCWLKFWQYDDVVYVPRSTDAHLKAVGEYLQLKLIDTKPSAECLAILLKILMFLYLPIFVMFEVIVTYNI